MKDILFLLLLSAQTVCAGLERYSQLVVSDSSTTPREGVRVTYLGTNGYQFESGNHVLLVDPYFSRVNLSTVLLGSRIQSDSGRIAEGMKHLASKADAILVTHGHFDHLLDVPLVMRKTGARLVASSTAVELAKRSGAPGSRCDTVTAGVSRRIGRWNIRVLAATHDRVLGNVPFNRREPRGIGPPMHTGDWVCGEPLAFLIEIEGQRIYIDSGGTPALLPPNSHVAGPGKTGQLLQPKSGGGRTEATRKSWTTQPIDSIGCPVGAKRVDLAILGVALPDSRERLSAVLERLHPRYVLPSHQDNFFRPLSAGFQFGPLTDFSRVRRECARENHGRLILLDYFRPWTLPRK